MKSKLIYLYPILILLLTWPIFAAWIPSLDKFWRWYLFAAGLSMFFATEYFSSKQFKYFIFYGIVILVNCFSGDKYMYNPFEIIFTLCGLFFITSTPIVLLKNRYRGAAKFYLFIFSLLLIYTTIASFLFNLEIPDVVRNDLSDTGLEEHSEYFYSYLYKFGLTKYQFAHAIPILIPVFVMIFRNTNNPKYSRLFFLFMTILAVLHSYISGSSTALFLAIFSTILSLIIKNDTFDGNKKRILRIGIFMLPFLFSSIQLYLLELFDLVVGVDGSIHEHILDLMQSIKGTQATGDLQARNEMYNISFKSFTLSPIWGSNDVVGGHSFFLDHLGAFGLLGFFPLIKFIFENVKLIKNNIPSKCIPYFLLCAFALLFLLATKNVNIIILSAFLFVTVPLYIKYYNNN